MLYALLNVVGFGSAAYVKAQNTTKRNKNERESSSSTQSERDVGEMNRFCKRHVQVCVYERVVAVLRKETQTHSMLGQNPDQIRHQAFRC